MQGENGPYRLNNVKLLILWRGCNGNWVDNYRLARKEFMAYKVLLEYGLVEERRRTKIHFSWRTTPKGCKFLGQFYRRRLLK